LKRSEVIVIALRLLSIYLLIMVLMSLPSALISLVAVMSASDTGAQQFAIPTMLYVIGYLVSFGVLWSFAPKIAKLIEGDMPEIETDKGEFTVTNVMIIGLALLGFLVLSKALPSLVKIAIAIMVPSLDAHFPKTLSMGLGRKALIPWSDIAAVIVQIGFGSWLIMGARGIASFLKKVRYAGR